MLRQNRSFSLLGNPEQLSTMEPVTVTAVPGSTLTLPKLILPTVTVQAFAAYTGVDVQSITPREIRQNVTTRSMHKSLCSFRWSISQFSAYDSPTYEN